MESQLQNVLASPVFDAVRRDSGLSAEEQALPTSMTEEEDAFGEVEPPNFGEVVRTVEVPRWLSDEGTVGELSDCEGLQFLQVVSGLGLRQVCLVSLKQDVKPRLP